MYFQRENQIGIKVDLGAIFSDRIELRSNRIVSWMIWDKPSIWPDFRWWCWWWQRDKETKIFHCEFVIITMILSFDNFNHYYSTCVLYYCTYDICAVCLPILTALTYWHMCICHFIHDFFILLFFLFIWRVYVRLYACIREKTQF